MADTYYLRIKRSTCLPLSHPSIKAYEKSTTITWQPLQHVTTNHLAKPGCKLKYRISKLDSRTYVWVVIANPVIAPSAPRNRIRNVASRSDTRKPHLHRSSAWTTFPITATHHGKVESVLYKTTRAMTKDRRKTTKYQLLGASGYCFRNIHVGNLNTEKCKTNLQHLLVVRIDVIIIDVLLPHSVGLPELPIKIRPYVFDARRTHPSPCRTYITPVPEEKMSERGPQTLQFQTVSSQSLTSVW
jgi:hypothetical protein